MPRVIPSLLLVLVMVFVASLVAACGSDTGGDTAADPATRGQQLADEKGCASCHGDDGEGRIGPAWQGLAGSEVTLEDGTTVTANKAYLRRSITNPSADHVEGFTTQMPTKNLSPDEVDALVAYITSLR